MTVCYPVKKRSRRFRMTGRKVTICSIVSGNKFCQKYHASFSDMVVTCFVTPKCSQHCSQKPATNIILSQLKLFKILVADLCKNNSATILPHTLIFPFKDYRPFASLIIYSIWLPSNIRRMLKSNFILLPIS